jgi:hypothetical protein
MGKQLHNKINEGGRPHELTILMPGMPRTLQLDAVGEIREVVIATISYTNIDTIFDRRS